MKSNNTKENRATRLAFEALDHRVRDNGMYSLRVGFVPFALGAWDYTIAGAGVVRISIPRAKRGQSARPYDRMIIELIEGQSLPLFSLRQKRELLRTFAETPKSP